jgi:hypothetical protein
MFTGIMLVFLAETCQGGEMAEGDTEDSVKTEMFDCFAFFCISLYTLYARMVFGLKQ